MKFFVPKFDFLFISLGVSSAIVIAIIMWRLSSGISPGYCIGLGLGAIAAVVGILSMALTSVYLKQAHKLEKQVYELRMKKDTAAEKRFEAKILRDYSEQGRTIAMAWFASAALAFTLTGMLAIVQNK